MYRKSSAPITSTLIGLLLIGMVILPISNLIPMASAAPGDLTAKWSRSGLGTNWEGGLVIGDVTGDGAEDVVYGGNDRLSVLNGNTGAVIATYSQTRIGQYCQPQLYDVDGNDGGILEILVPLYYSPGLACVQYDGDSTLSQMWIADVQGSGGSGSVMAKPVAGDIDGDGDLDIFLASQDVSPNGGYDGTISRISNTGAIVAQNFAWRACSGGLSLADTDSDGVFEIYQGDRDIDYGDGNYGKGTKSFWADNLTERWNRLDALTSSQAPVLVDVNKDGILDVLAGMYSEMTVLNSSNGEWISHFSHNNMSVHYGFTVYDIDGDGHLELLCNDGDHDDQPYTDVFDLVTGQMEAQLYHFGQELCDDENYLDGSEFNHLLGTSKWSPLVADINPNHPGMEIISVPEGTGLDGGNWWNGAILVWSSNYQSLQNITRSTSGLLGSQLSYPTVQDIDGDGLLELVICASSGTVYAYDTSAPEPVQRIRSDVTFFGEKRTGVAVYDPLPWAPNYWTAPLVAPVSIADNALKVSQSTTSLTFKLREHQSQPMNYTVTTFPDIGSRVGSSTGNPYNWGTYTLTFSQPLQYDTSYTWTVNATDGTQSTVRSYTFRTALAPNAGNSVPTQANPTLISQDGLGTTASTFIGANGTTTEPNGDAVTNIYTWSVDGQQVANVVLPFDTRNETVAKDYSAYGNNGNVVGATWTPNGKVGGCYSFDGKDDAIILSDGGVGYFDNKTHSDYNRELGGGGTWNEVSVEAWIYLTEYNNGSRIVAKLPSYELGFQTGSTSRLMASVWPQQFTVADDDNAASTDRQQSASANVAIALNTWYHIAFTYESGVGLKLFFNGVMVASRLGISGPLENSLGEPVYIGRLVQPFAGKIDEVRIYQHALSATQINNSYLSTKDGLSTSSLFCPIGIAAPGATLSCTVIPNDSFGDGLPHSASVVLLNTPPDASNLKVYPVRERDIRLDNENIGVVYTYFDPDGQIETNSQIRWYMNGAVQTSLNDDVEVPAATTQVGQAWYFTITPRDSTGGLGVTRTSPAVTIRGNTAPDTGIPTLDSMNGGVDYDDDDLVGTAAATTDGNSDETTNIFHWTKSGVSQTNLQMPFDTEVPQIPNTNGITSDYSGYGNHGSVNGSTWTQDGVIGGALNFDGNDSVLVQEQSNSLGGNGAWTQISVEFWAKTSPTAGTETVIMKHNDLYSTSNDSPYGVCYRVDLRGRPDGYQVYWYIYNSTGTQAVNSVNFRVTEGPGVWHHIVCTYQSGVGLKLFTDGILRASLMASGNINATSNGRLHIGGLGVANGDYIGSLDEVRIYPNALSAAQIFQRFIDTRDGVGESETVVPQETSSGNSWICQVIPNDSWIDGATRASTPVSVVAGDGRPRIDLFSPTNTTLTANVGDNVNFTQVAGDPNGGVLSYQWTLDSILKATSQNWTYTPASASIHTVTVTVSDGSMTDSQTWSVNVNQASNSYNLTIGVGGNGNTNPVPGTYQYPEKSLVNVQAIPTLGFQLSYWLLNNTNVGSANPYQVNMTGNYNLTAVFISAPIIQYNLHVETRGSGVTNATGDNLYNAGTNVAVQATAGSGWILSYWLLNNTNVGSANPYALVMNANYNCTAVFTEIPPIVQYNLHVQASGSGSTNATENMLYNAGTQVAIQATPSGGWTFGYWLLNDTNVGSANPYALVMNANYNLTAVFAQVITYTLNLAVTPSGSGTTNPAVGDHTYNAGQNAQVTANAAAGYVFDHWVLDNVGVGNANPYSLTMNADHNLTAVFVVTPDLFNDGFESGSFSMWTGPTVTSGETATVLGVLPHHGSYSARFTSNGGGGTERAYITRSIAAPSGLYVRGYFNIASGLPLQDANDRFNIYALQNGATTIASLGVRRSGTSDLWSLTSNVGTWYASSGPSMNTWYCVEFYALVASSGGIFRVWVNGQLIIEQTGLNTAGAGSVNSVRTGLAYVYSITNSVTLYSDCYVFSGNYVGTEGAPIQYSLDISVTGSGTTNPAVGSYSYNAGTTVPVQANAGSGYEFSHWMLNGNNVGNANPYQVIMNDDHDLTAVFTPIVPPTMYNLLIETRGSGSTNPVPGIHPYEDGTGVSVDAQPTSGYRLDYWLLNGTNVGSTDPLPVTVNQNLNLTAVFVEIPPPTMYGLLIETRGSGTTNPVPGTQEYQDGTLISVDAQPISGYKLDYWLLNGTNVGSTDPYQFTIDQDRNLTAVFVVNPITSVLEDGFESGAFGAWTSTSVTSGETAAVVTSPVHAGVYSARFTSNGQGGYERGCVTKTLTPTLNELYVRGYFSLTQNGMVESSDRIKLIELRAGSTIIGAAGLRRSGSNLVWWMETRNGATYTETFTSIGGIDVSQWFSLEFKWTNDATAGGGALYVNGAQIYSISNANTSNYGSCSQVRVGLAEIYNCASSTVLLDDVVIATSPIGP
jgi:hypothetical protein